VTIKHAFQDQVATWVQRARKFGAAGVGHVKEDHVQQGCRIERELGIHIPQHFYHHILDFGSGWGRFTKFLEPRGSHVWAVDVVPQWVTAVAQLSPTLTALKLTEPQLPLASASIDLALDIMTLQSITSEQLLAQFSAELRRVVQPGGVILSLHKNIGGVRAPAVAAARLGLAEGWAVVMTTAINVAGDECYFLVGTRAGA